MKSAIYLIYASKKCRRVLCDVFKVLVVWLLLKMLRSTVLVSFAGHTDFLTLQRPLDRKKWTVTTCFQHKECICLATVPRT